MSGPEESGICVEGGAGGIWGWAGCGCLEEEEEEAEVGVLGCVAVVGEECLIVEDALVADADAIAFADSCFTFPAKAVRSASALPPTGKKKRKTKNEREEGRKKRPKSHTILDLQKVLYQILHQPVLLRHVPLEIDHLLQHLLVIPLQTPNMRAHVLLRAREAVDLRLQRRARGRAVPRAVAEGGRGGGRGQGGGGEGRVRGCGRGGGVLLLLLLRGLALRGHFALDVLERVAPLGVEVGVAERPALFLKH